MQLNTKSYDHKCKLRYQVLYKRTFSKDEVGKTPALIITHHYLTACRMSESFTAGKANVTALFQQKTQRGLLVSLKECFLLKSKQQKNRQKFSHNESIYGFLLKDESPSCLHNFSANVLLMQICFGITEQYIIFLNKRNVQD